MSLEDSLCPQSTVYVPRVQFVSPSTIYISGVHFMSQEYSFSPKSTVYVPRVQFMFP